MPIIGGLTTFLAGLSTYVTLTGANQFNDKLNALNNNVTDLINGQAAELDLLREALDEAQEELGNQMGEGG